jgi:signal transduction histidine kinase
MGATSLAFEDQPTLLSKVAHELRAPLTSLIMGSQLLADDFEQLDVEQVRELVSTIHRGTIWLQSLVENLLCTATVQAGRFLVHLQPVDVADVMADVESVVGPLLAQQHQELRLFGRGGSAPLWADRRRLVQVLVNLITNASKFSAVGAPIDVTIRAREGHLRVTVADRGPGLPRGRAARLFEPYYRGATAAEADKEGIGLGLAIVHWIVTEHSGRVGARNRRGGGAEFWFELPTGSRAVSHAK